MKKLTLADVNRMIAVLNGGEGSGFFAPEHQGRPGKRGGSTSGKTSASKHYEGRVIVGKNLGTATARAEYGGNISINLDNWNELSEKTKRFVIAHELAHHTVEDMVLHDNDLWDKASDVLTIQELPDGRRLFAGGNTRIGEAISDTIAAYLTDDTIPRLQSDWKGWSKEMINKAGYDEIALKEDVNRLFREAEEL